MLKRHLAEAEEHIATGDKNIARQRDLIAQLEVNADFSQFEIRSAYRSVPTRRGVGQISTARDVAQQ